MPTPAAPRFVPRSKGERRVTYLLKVLVVIVLGAVIVSAILDFIGRVPSVAAIVIGAVFFTYIIYPIVRRLHARMPLVWAIVLVYAGILALVAIAISTVAPALYEQAEALVRSTPELVRNAQSFVTDAHNPIIARLPQPVRDYLATVPPQLAALAQRYAGAAAGQLVSIAVSVVGLLATVVVIPVISVYLMFEAPDLIASFLRAMPAKARPKAASIIHDLDKALGGFIRGQLLVGAVIGTCITIALFVLHVKYALLIGVTAGLLDVIPYVGAIVGIVPSLTLAFLNDGWQHAVLVAIVFVLIFQLEGHFIAPRIVSESVGLTPLMVIVAILIGGELLGLAGMFLAVPIAAVLRVLVLQALPSNPDVVAVPIPPATSAMSGTTASPVPPVTAVTNASAKQRRTRAN